jgi:molecular chaperone GrpE
LEEANVLNSEKTVEEKLAAAEEEIAGFRDKMLRAAAEFDNSKKRMERDRLAALKYAGEPVLREMLPVVDNLERALAQGVVAGADVEKSMAALQEGVQLTLKSLLTTLEKFEVKPIDSIGKPFDPNIHEALVMEASDEVPASHVLTEFEKGYFYKDRLLRVAKVVVSSGKAAI